MVKLLFVLMNEYRLWALPQALAALERRYPGAVEGRVYSVQGDKCRRRAGAGPSGRRRGGGHGLSWPPMARFRTCTAFPGCGRRWRGGRSILPPPWGTSWPSCSPGWGWSRPSTPALDSYYQAGSLADLEGLVLCALNGRSQPPPRGRGPGRTGGRPLGGGGGGKGRGPPRTPRTGFDTSPPLPNNVGGGPLGGRGGVPTPVRLLRRRPRDGQGILYRMERFYRRADGTPPFRGRWWCPTASA